MAGRGVARESGGGTAEARTRGATRAGVVAAFEGRARAFSREGFTERWNMAIAIGAFAVVIGLFSAPLFAGKLLFSFDLFGSFYPTSYFFHRCLHNGDSFLWMPLIHGGCYLHGIGQAGMMHPLQLLLYSVLPWPWPFALIFPLSYPVMFLGMYLMLRREGLERGAALFGGLVTALSGFTMLHWMHVSAIAVLAHIPWLLVLVQELARHPSPRRTALAAAGISVLTASQCLVGYPQYVYFSCLVEGAYILFLLRRSRWLRLVVLIGTAKVLGLVLAGVQLVPTWDLVAYSARSVPDAAFRSSYSLPPYMLLQFFGSDLFDQGVQNAKTHEYGVYCGAATFLLAIWAIARFRHLSSKHIWAFVLLAVGIVFALGEYGRVYTLVSYLPLLNKFRCPCRHLAVVHIALGILAAWGFMDLTRTHDFEAFRRSRVAVTIALVMAWFVPICAVLLSAVRGPWTPWLDSIRLATPTRMFAGAILFTMAGALIFAAARGWRLALPLLILFAAADQGSYGLRYVYSGPVLDPAKLVEGFVKPPGPERSISRYQSNMSAIMLTMAGYPTFDGYTGLLPKRRLNYATPAALRVAGVRWLDITPRERLLFEYPEPDTPDRPVWEDLGPALPRTRLVSQVEVCAEPNTRLAEIDPEKTALVDEALPLDEGAPGTAIIEEDRPGRITLRTDAPGRQLLVTTESYHGGWQALVDGVAVPALPVYGDFIGCPVPGGEHEVRLEFRPKSMVWGVRTTFAGAVGTLLMALFLWLVPRRTGHTVGKDASGRPA